MRAAAVGGRLGPGVSVPSDCYSSETLFMKALNSPHRRSKSKFCNGFDFPFACVSAVAFTCGILSLYLSLTVRQIISL